MGLKKRFKARAGTSPEGTSKRMSLINVFIPPSEVTEESLQVWRALPLQVRKDPSWASFQIENERLHGTLPNEDDTPEPEEEESSSDENHYQESEFITIKMPHHRLFRKKSVETQHSDTSAVSEAENHVTFTKPLKYRKHIKMVFLLVLWFLCAAALVATTEKVIIRRQVVVPPHGVKYYLLPHKPPGKKFSLELVGAFLQKDFNNDTEDFLTVQVQAVTNSNDNISTTEIQNILSPFNVPITTPRLYESCKRQTRLLTLKISDDEKIIINKKDTMLRLVLNTSNPDTAFAFQIGYNTSPVDMVVGATCAAIILITLYSLIIWEVVHRTFAAVITSIMSIAILSVLECRPSMATIVEWMDIETLLLLFSMMILVALLTESGVFDYLAVMVFEKTGGKIWPLIYCCCVITACVSAFLDNVTTILLMTPVTIRLCEVMELNPIPVLIGIVVHANIGGMLTPIGDPPSFIIYHNKYISSQGVTFFTFVEHMAPAVILTTLQSCLQLRFVFRKTHDLRLKEPKAIKELRREITVWQRAADSLTSYSKDADLVKETLLKKVKIMRHKLKKQKMAGPASTEVYKQTLDELKATYPIKNKTLLVMSSVVLIFIIAIFFLQSVPGFRYVPLGFVALLGVLFLLVIADRNDIDALMSRVEWTTLLFFAALFVTMESLTQMGLNDWIGMQTENIILCVDERSRLAVAIFIILWVSALTSAFVETLPVTAMMVQVVVSLAEKNTLGLPIKPLVWALALGSCLGGNGTLYGSSANIICAGIAEQHGYRFSFTKFFKVSYPMMIGSLIVTTAYLLIAHVLFDWN